MTNRINRQSEAFRTALDYCRFFRFDWRRHIEPKTNEREIVGHFIIDETYTTTVATVML